MTKGYDLSGYVDVATRIAQFAAKYPEGSLQSELLWENGGWLCRAYAYRTPEDPRPGIGHAFEPVPGKTPYTKDSEAMNAETSAWGRAIVALGFETKNIASADEVRAREHRTEGPAPQSPPRSWTKVRELVEGSEVPTAWEVFDAYVRAASYHLFGETESKKLTPDQRKVMLQKAAGAAVWLAENPNTPVGGTLSVEHQRQGWAAVMDGAQLEVPDLGTESPPEDEDELERLARLAEETIVGPPE